MATNGDIYVTDGYRKARVHRLRATAGWSSWARRQGRPFHLPHSIAFDDEANSTWPIGSNKRSIFTRRASFWPMDGMGGRTTSPRQGRQLLHCRAGGRRKPAYVASAMQRNGARRMSRMSMASGSTARRHLRRIDPGPRSNNFVRLAEAPNHSSPASRSIVTAPSSSRARAFTEARVQPAALRCPYCGRRLAGEDQSDLNTTPR